MTQTSESSFLVFFYRGHKSPYFTIVRFHWVQLNLELRAILKSHRTPIGCHFHLSNSTFHCHLNAIKTLPATSLFVSANRVIIATYSKFNVGTPTSRVNSSRRLVVLFSDHMRWSSFEVALMSLKATMTQKCPLFVLFRVSLLEIVAFVLKICQLLSKS